ncbi:phenol 2-monooxygenase [Aaosphaeria arxii CBS 175.79]|uniref:Phenol 2-monooxygenase n=1 Tax=Aaosphaeria arxii CBS 175.79 TaxID=1450172 RepID=A0A6A5Y1P5_9PLEO|nr:phenol 2-monooxygenase [Aaosphaeria arxii CBS 175.79]KAF2019176.1 phenol 2-monooxygenase [Aaosphaeria arxii CBS 175.79]
MLAAWMARCGINARIVDKRGTKIYAGQADGLQMRSLEIFDSFGFADRAWKEANHMIEMCMWNPGQDGVIRRSDRVPDVPVGLSRFQQIVLHQGRIERFFLDHIKKHSEDRIRVERGVLPEVMSFSEEEFNDHSIDTYPITVKLRHLTEEEAMPEQSKASEVSDGLFRSNLAADDTDDLIRQSVGKEGTAEIVRAKYVVGCDGAHSWTRKQLGFELEGEPTDFIWGVLDIIPITDFPDIRMRCAIHSASSGSMMVIPRENKLVRLYIQLTEIKPDASGRADRSKITPATIIAAAQKIIAPYKLTYEYCDWWTAYQIGQRVGTNFDYSSRVFLAGDAVHTHSPKAGQGMNVSMQDAYNLGWKLGLVIRGIARPEILKTYQSERRRVAQDLIAFDHKFSRLFSGRPAKDVLDEEGVSMEAFRDAFVKGNMFASGLSVDYGSSMLIAKEGSSIDQGDGTDVSSSYTKTRVVGRQELATNIKLGMRFPNYKVLNQSDARPWHLQENLRSDGRFRIIVFAGDVLFSTQKSKLEAFCDLLSSSQFLAPYLHRNIAMLTVHSSKRTETELLRDFPEVLHPFDTRTGWDYDSVFVDDESYHEGFGDAYNGYGVDKEAGCVVITRPDQYVGFIGSLNEQGWEGVEGYFKGVLMS